MSFTRLGSNPLIAWLYYPALRLCIAAAVLGAISIETSQVKAQTHSSLDVANLQAAIETKPHYLISTTGHFSGMDLAPNGKTILVAISGEKDAALKLLSIEDLEVRKSLTLPTGIMPADPTYDSTKTRIVFAGFCEPSSSLCNRSQGGWNIYTYDLATDTTRQVTTYQPDLVRRDPIWGSDGQIYYVGFSPKFGGTAMTAANGIYVVSPSGADAAIFPRSSVSERSGTFASFIGKATSLSLISADQNGLIFKARLAVPPSRLPDHRFEYIQTATGLMFDDRLRRFADDRIYSLPADTFLRSETVNTLFLLKNDSLAIYHERDAVTGPLPESAWHVRAATAGDGAIWVMPSTIENAFASALLRFADDEVDIVDPTAGQSITLEGRVVDFEVAAGRFILATRTQDRGVQFWTLREGRSPLRFFIKSP
ncbi:MAG: hypothetical protein N4A53_04730 [Pelagimonas sp.]|jgi:hypothetical protein|nr:hypothetical protein [Pelagimonas sp.]